MPVSGTNSPAIPRGVRLVLPELPGIEALDPGEPVLAPAAFELVEPRQLALRDGDDHLAAALVRDPLLLGRRKIASRPSAQSRALSEPGL